MKKLNGLLLIALSFALATCSSRKPASSVLKGGTQKGYASWYGKDFHGKKTASGEVYNMNDLTAAHKYLPFGTLLKVTRLDNQKSVSVRINDRGPFVKDRIIDLSAAAARVIALDVDGVAPVSIEKTKDTATIAPQNPSKTRAYYLQVASFIEPKHAKDYAEYVSLLNTDQTVQLAYLNQQHKVWVGPLYTAKDLTSAQSQLKSQGIESVILRRS